MQSRGYSSSSYAGNGHASNQQSASSYSTYQANENNSYHRSNRPELQHGAYNASSSTLIHPDQQRYSRPGESLPYLQTTHLSSSSHSPTSPLSYNSAYSPTTEHPRSTSERYSSPPAQQFIPTPSDLMSPSYRQYSSAQNDGSMANGSYHGRYSQPAPIGGMVNTYPNHNGSSPTAGPHAQQNATPGPPERYPCEICKGKTFSRSHDRKRHYETHHSAYPPVHVCRFCNKPFSRSDSLKRHQDNGCDGSDPNKS